ncbi:reverse transcriptase domain-containing protein [Tanacetum coccineum]
MPCPCDLRGIGIAGSIGQTSIAKSGMGDQPETTINEYLTTIRDDSGSGIVKPLVKENIKFKFWGQCIDELKNNLFFRNKDEDPHEHISNITNVLFHSLEVSKDLMAFPFTLKGRARQWMKKLSTGSITTWVLFKNAFLSKYRSPSQIIKQINAIRSFEQKSNEPLHFAWERRKVDFKGPIPRMTPINKIKAITELSKHSLSQYKEGDIKNNDINIVFKQINNFEQNINVITEEVRMAQHRYKIPVEGRISKLEETMSTFIKESLRRQKESENLVWRLKKITTKPSRNKPL